MIELAKKHPVYGYREVWALLGDERHRVSQSTVYRWLKEEDLLLDPRYHMQARRRAKKARRKYFQPPGGPNELWQVDITWVDVGDYGMYYTTNVVDYASRFPLASVFSSTHTTEDVISALAEALREANRLRGELPEQIVLVSDNGPQFLSKRLQKWLQEEHVPFKHVRGRACAPTPTDVNDLKGGLVLVTP